MTIKPQKCCAIGSYECQVPMPLNGRTQGIDYCIADIVAALNAANISTKMSCCGHGNEDIAVICLADGRELSVSGHTPSGVDVSVAVHQPVSQELSEREMTMPMKGKCECGDKRVSIFLDDKREYCETCGWPIYTFDEHLAKLLEKNK